MLYGVLPGYQAAALKQCQFLMNAGKCLSVSMQLFLGHQIVLEIYG